MLEEQYGPDSVPSVEIQDLVNALIMGMPRQPRHISSTATCNKLRDIRALVDANGLIDGYRSFWTGASKRTRI